MIPKRRIYLADGFLDGLTDAQLELFSTLFEDYHTQTEGIALSLTDGSLQDIIEDLERLRNVAQELA